MVKVRRSPLAEEDYRDIWRHIATDNPDAADRFLLRVDSKLQLYAKYPLMGSDRRSLGPNLRSFPVGNYLAFYQIVPGGIELVRLLHAARSLESFVK